MTPNPYELLFCILFALSLVTFAAARSVSMLAAINAVSLTCAPMLGHPSLPVFGHVGDIGAGFFAIALYGVSLKYLVYGPDMAYRSTGPTTLALVFVFGSIFFLQNANMLGAGINARIQVAGVRLIVFCLMLPLFVYLLQRRSVWPCCFRIPVITAMIAVLDGLVSFPCAYYGILPEPRLVSFMAVCITIRLTVIAVSVPVLAMFLWLQGRGLVAAPAAARS